MRSILLLVTCSVYSVRARRVVGSSVRGNSLVRKAREDGRASASHAAQEFEGLARVLLASYPADALILSNSMSTSVFPLSSRQTVDRRSSPIRMQNRGYYDRDGYYRDNDEGIVGGVLQSFGRVIQGAGQAITDGETAISDTLQEKNRQGYVAFTRPGRNAIDIFQERFFGIGRQRRNDNYPTDDGPRRKNALEITKERMGLGKSWENDYNLYRRDNRHRDNDRYRDNSYSRRANDNYPVEYDSQQGQRSQRRSPTQGRSARMPNNQRKMRNLPTRSLQERQMGWQEQMYSDTGNWQRNIRNGDTWGERVRKSQEMSFRERQNAQTQWAWNAFGDSDGDSPYGAYGEMNRKRGPGYKSQNSRRLMDAMLQAIRRDPTASREVGRNPHVGDPYSSSSSVLNIGGRAVTRANAVFPIRGKNDKQWSAQVKAEFSDGDRGVRIDDFIVRQRSGRQLRVRGGMMSGGWW